MNPKINTLYQKLKFFNLNIKTKAHVKYTCMLS